MTNTYGHKAKVIDLLVALRASTKRAHELVHMLEEAADNIEETGSIKQDVAWWGAFWSEFAYDIDPVATTLAEDVNEIRCKIDEVSDLIMAAKENHQASIS